MWQELRMAAVEDRKLVVAQRCSAALGDVAKAQFLGVINADAKKAAADMGGDGLDNYAVKVGGRGPGAGGRAQLAPATSSTRVMNPHF